MSLFGWIRNSIHILDVVMEYTSLKQVGNYWKGTCPFHTERDASFTVSPEKQIFYCFGCQVSGDVVGFIAKAEKLSQFDAATLLIEKKKLDVPKDIKKSFAKNNVGRCSERYFVVHECVAQWCHQQLLKNKGALEYLLSRGISREMIDLFNIGYFPAGSSVMAKLQHYLAEKGILLNDLLSSNIVTQHSSSHYGSFFEERVMFPIHDIHARLCGFGGRIFKNNDKRAKYYNSKESDGFKKGKLLFGFEVAKKTIIKEKVAFLVEGYMDCIAMVQHGFVNTVATLGTACTLDHLTFLSRYITKLLFVYDGDKAGHEALVRIAQHCWQVDLDFSVVLLPKGDDPASFLEKDGDLTCFVQKEKSIFNFFIEHVAHDFVQRPLKEKIEAAKSIVALVVKIDDQFKQDLLLHEAAAAMQMPFQVVKNLLKSSAYALTCVKQKEKSQKDAASNEISNGDPAAAGEERIVVPLLEEKIFAAIINNIGDRDVFNVDSDTILLFSSTIQKFLRKLADLVKDTPRTGHKEMYSLFVRGLSEREYQWVTRVSMAFGDLSQEMFDQLMSKFYKINWKRALKVMTQQMREAELRGDQKELTALFEKLSTLKRKIQGRGLI